MCSRCRFVFYLNPKVVAATIPEQDGAILLTRRSINPGSGLWTFPGGFVDFGETVTDGAMRETFEETGLKVDLTGLLNVYTYPAAPVIIVYKARVIGGTLTTCDENDALEWVTPERIPWDVLAFQSTREALRDWVASAGIDAGRLAGALLHRAREELLHVGDEKPLVPSLGDLFLFVPRLDREQVALAVRLEERGLGAHLEADGGRARCFISTIVPTDPAPGGRCGRSTAPAASSSSPMTNGVAKT